jgi:chitin disaccharide deacetylase
MKTVWLCADDYAQNAEISEGIRYLYALQHINAISCMTNTPFWHQEGSKLLELHPYGYWGLHLNLTHGLALSKTWRSFYGERFHSLGWVMTRWLSVRALEEEFRAQFDAFCDVTGRLPDFIDGHQHVHQFPQVADVLIPLLEAYRFRGMVRVSGDVRGIRLFPLKSAVIALCGANRLRRLLIQRGLEHNTSFDGVYPFHYASHYGDYFKGFLRQSADDGLIMCHPGYSSHDRQDPLRVSRYQEFLYLSGETLRQDLQQYGVVLKEKRRK